MISKKDLSTKEVCEIIASCAQHQVSTLQWGDLSVSFSSPGKREEHVAPPGPVTQPLTQEQHEKQNAEALMQSEVRLREDRLAHMFIEDPAAAEEMLRGEDLDDTDEDDESTED